MTFLVEISFPLVIEWQTIAAAFEKVGQALGGQLAYSDTSYYYNPERDPCSQEIAFVFANQKQASRFAAFCRATRGVSVQQRPL
jgi:hypothetical protein